MKSQGNTTIHIICWFQQQKEFYQSWRKNEAYVVIMFPLRKNNSMPQLQTLRQSVKFHRPSLSASGSQCSRSEGIG